jgi:predicted DNA binding CopG/RHH family protein
MEVIVVKEYVTLKVPIKMTKEMRLNMDKFARMNNMNFDELINSIVTHFASEISKENLMNKKIKVDNLEDREVKVTVRISSKLRKYFEEFAEACGTNLSDFIRSVLIYFQMGLLTGDIDAESIIENFKKKYLMKASKNERKLSY